MLLYLHEVFHTCVWDNMVTQGVDVELRKGLVLLKDCCQLLQTFAWAALQPLFKEALHPSIHVLPELIGCIAPWKQSTGKA